MLVEKAKAHYLGKNGHKKLNCGQAVLCAFKEKFALGEGLVTRFESYGGGRAPEGHCASFYAAKVILEKIYPEKFKECEAMFVAHAGSTKCKEIRSLRKLPCLGCVEKIAEYVDKI